MMLDELVHRVDAARFEVSVACLEDGPWPERLRTEGVTVHVVEQTRWRDVRNVVNVSKVLRDIVRSDGVDLVHANGASSLLCATLAGRRAGVPVTWVVFDPLTGLSPRRLLTARRHVTARLLGALHPDFVVFGTDRAEEGTPVRRSTPTATILPGIDLARHTWTDGDGSRARLRLGIPDGAPMVAMFGRLTFLKSQKEMLRAMRILLRTHPETRAVICGSEADRGYTAQVRALRSELDLEDRVTLTGFAPDDLKDDVLAAADLVVHLAKRESFGLAVVEAQAAGKAVVAVDASGPRSLIDDGVTGVLVPVDDVDRLASVVGELLSDPARRASIGARAAASALAHSIETMVERFEEVWETVLAGRSPVGDGRAAGASGTGLPRRVR